VTTENPSSSSEPGPIAKAAVGSVIFGALKQVADREIDSSMPKFTFWTDRTRAVRRIALRLAEEGREDAGAVKELKDAASWRPKELRRAAATFREDGWNVEDITCNRANRLLLAAATGEPVPTLTETEKEWFRTLEVLQHLPVDAAFSRLVVMEPDLALLSHEVETAAEQRDPDDEGYEDRTWNLIWDRCNVLVGLESQSTQPLIRTMIAKGIAFDHLRALGDLPPFGQETQE